MNLLRTTFLFCAVLILSQCYRYDSPPPAEARGLKPVYSANPSLQVLPARPLRKLGKIYYKAPLIYTVEMGVGIHVIDNSNPAAPVPLRFYAIPGCSDLAIKNDRLYTDQASDLLVIDISQPDSLRVLQRQSIRAQNVLYHLPPGYSGYIECPDPSKGVIVGWEETLLQNPTCQTSDFFQPE